MTPVSEVVPAVVADWRERLRQDIRADILVAMRFYAHVVRSAKTAEDAVQIAGELADELYRLWRHYRAVMSIQREVERLQRQSEAKQKLLTDDYITATLERDARRAKPLESRLRESVMMDGEDTTSTQSRLYGQSDAITKHSNRR
ncbi:hypothetical protein HRbin16_03058 [bacterium HR16]|nr:hypothetical protein HRbin16_03058 [bacterium HR16]